MKLVYVNHVGKDSNDIYEYEFFFSDTPDIVWGQDWNEQCPSACEDTLPDSSTYNEIKILRTPIPFSCAQENSCFSLQDMIDGVICCAYFEKEEKFVPFNFGIDINEVNKILSSENLSFQ